MARLGRGFPVRPRRVRPVGAAPVTAAVVQQITGSAASATGFTTNAVTSSAGSVLLLVVGRSGGTATGALTSVTDQVGNTWSVVTRGSVSGSSNTRVELWSTTQDVGPLNAQTITVTSATAQTSDYSVIEVVGVDRSALLDGVSPDNSGVTSATPSTPAVTTTGSGDLVLSIIHHAYNVAPDTMSTVGWTVLDPAINGTVHSTSIAYQVETSAGTYGPTWTRGGAVSGPTGVITAAFKAGSLAGPSARGTITLGGAATAGAPASAAGSITLGGSVAPAFASAAASGSVALGGGASSTVPASGAGVVTLGGAATAGAPASATGTVALSGSTNVGGQTAATASGSMTLGAAPVQVTATAAASGSVSVTGTTAARVVAATGGVIVLGGTGAARATSTSNGLVVLGGAVTVRVPTTVAGLITLSGLAAGSLDTYFPHTYVTAVLLDNRGAAALSDRAATAALAVVPPALADVLAVAPALATLVGNGQSVAALATDGTTTATLADRVALSTLQTTT